MSEAADRTFTVAVVDDNSDVRHLLRLRIDLEHDLEWLGEAEDGIAGMELVLERRPDAVILNVELPRLNGLSVLAGVRDAGYAGVIVIYTASAAAVAHAIADGADGAFQKTQPVTELLALVAERCRSKDPSG